MDEDRPGADAWVPARPDLSSLRAAAVDCHGCELWQKATQVVFSSGSVRARIMLVGEQPGDQEDREGEPFIGPAGRVLDEALVAAGIPRGEVYLTNAVKHFRFKADTRGKRRIHDKPAVVHIEACRPWLEAELDVVKPAVVVCLGATAARAILRRSVLIGAERGRMQPAPGVASSGVLVTTHPSAVLRLRGKAEWDEAFDRFVADLMIAREAAAGG
jgi:uracil-DNA glycosylase family protein